MEKQVVTVALVGMGGFGVHYVNAILNQSEEFEMRCVGMISTHPERYADSVEFKAKNIPIYRTMEELYENQTPQLIFISSPIQFHCRQICYALEHGSNVLCEKPTAATEEDARRIIEKSKAANRFVAIGYQRCYSRAVLKAKEDVLSGLYGKPVVFKCIAMPRRNLDYFGRGWTGKIKAGEDYVNDSIANNACAHHLHHLFFMAGEALNQSAYPAKIEAECYRVNDIENFDTVTIRVTTKNEVRLYFGGTHCAKEPHKPYIVCEFECGKIVFDENTEERLVTGYLDSGEVIEYGSMKEDNFRKIPCAVEAVRGEDTIYCDANTALPHSITIQHIQNNVEIRDLRNRAKLYNVASEKEPKYMKYIEGLGEDMLTCFHEEKMLSSILSLEQKGGE